MRVVVDSNRARSEELVDFFLASQSNRAVVTDWLMMEAYKGNTLIGVRKTLAILARFPKQVIVLKNTGTCMRVPVGPQMANRLIWREHTKTFQQFVKQVNGENEDGYYIEDLLLERGDAARERMKELLDDAPAMLEQRKKILSYMSAEDIAVIRGKGSGSPQLLQRIIGLSSVIAARHRTIFEPAQKPPTKHLSYEFIFRMGLAITALFLDWVRTGSQLNIRPEKVRNDYVDATLSVYGTYFNGIMSGDAQLNLTHAVTRRLLYLIRATTPPPYLACW